MRVDKDEYVWEICCTVLCLQLAILYFSVKYISAGLIWCSVLSPLYRKQLKSKTRKNIKLSFHLKLLSIQCLTCPQMYNFIILNLYYKWKYIYNYVNMILPILYENISTCQYIRTVTVEDKIYGQRCNTR